MTKKSYWQAMSLSTLSDKQAAKSWFYPLCDEDMIPFKAEVLLDSATDQEKKLKVFMTDGAGKHYEFVRTRGPKNYSITKKPLAMPSISSNHRGTET